MKLTDSEREEFIRLAEETYDPELWTEEDLPALRAARQAALEERRREEASPVPEPADDQQEIIEERSSGS